MRLPPITEGTKRADTREALSLENNGRLLTPFAKGFNSYAYQVEGAVVKIARRSLPTDAAKDQLLAAYEHYSLLSNYLGDLVVATSFSLKRDTQHKGRLHLVTAQPYIEGVTLKSTTEFNPEALLELFEACLRMYEDTGKIGDIAAIEGRFFNPFKTRNIIINPQGEPTLADVDTGKIQSSDLLGATWSKFIANGTRRGIRHLKR